MSVVLETKQLEKIYLQGKINVPALRGIDFSVQKGEFVAILGPSGSGKSTLMNLLGALDSPTHGSVLVNGKDTALMNKDQLAELRQTIGFVFQYFNLVPRLTAFKNVELSIAIKEKIKGAKRKKKVEEILTLVGLGDRIDHKNTELSGGQQQRVAIARALAQDPAFLLLDEPTGNVDTKTRDTLMELIEILNEERGITIIMITHDLNVAKHAKRIIHLVDGKIYADKPIDQFDFMEMTKE